MEVKQKTSKNGIMENKITGNEPAFSKAAFYHPDGGCDSPNTGLTIRQYFAVTAMQGMLSDYTYVDGCTIQSAAQDAVSFADALITELNK